MCVDTPTSIVRAGIAQRKKTNTLPTLRYNPLKTDQLCGHFKYRKHEIVKKGFTLDGEEISMHRKWLEERGPVTDSNAVCGVNRQHPTILCYYRCCSAGRKDLRNSFDPAVLVPRTSLVDESQAESSSGASRGHGFQRRDAHGIWLGCPASIPSS